MGIGSRPATCTSCGKRLGRKSWYYRNGSYFCRRRCWITHSAKAAEEAEKASGAKTAAAQAVASPAPAAATPKADTDVTKTQPPAG